MLINKATFNIKNLINLLLALIPLSLILGNLAININIILIGILGLIVYRLEIFRITEKKYRYLIYGFFLYLILITLINNLPNLNVDSQIHPIQGGNFYYSTHIFKSILFLRYLLLFLVINKLAEKNDLKIKPFFLSCAFFALLIAVDIMIQVSFEKNLIGLPVTSLRPSSFFAGEHIAGGYIQKFSLFFIFYIIFYFLNKKNIRTDFYILIHFIFFFISIVLTLNRMSALIYFLSIIIFFLMEKRFKLLLVSILMFTTIIFLAYRFSPIVRMGNQLKTFYFASLQIAKILPKLVLSDTYEIKKNSSVSGSGYLLHFNSGIQVWKQSKVFGKGLKSFRLNCSYEMGQTCNTHPHNYILELLVDTGVVGFLLIYFMFIFVTFNFIKFYNYNFNSSIKYIGLPFFLILFFEFFPIRSTGSFFTTSNATIIFMMFAFLINISKLNFREIKSR